MSRVTIPCAIYTRVSTDSGLDQKFNSLDAQHEACSAYIRSQAHAGWTLGRIRYDDGGFSGGSTERPALRRLLADVRVHRIKVIIVYKVDRLTRSLADFARLVDLFDAHDVSFVSVTQQFNTTTSMGRLTLNVLLSFAQFEREVTAERIRDKIAASKRKGLWVGGMVPLGYDAKDRKIWINEAEADTVRHIFKRYLEVGSLNLLLADLRTSGITTRVRPLSTGRTIGGIPFTRGPLAYLLRNRFYIGDVVFKGEVLPGQQPPILERPLFDAVQARLDAQRTHHVTRRFTSQALLMGLIHDGHGYRMSPSHSTKSGRRHRYYISRAMMDGRPEERPPIHRVNALQIEALVINAVWKHLDREAIATEAQARDLIRAHVARVDIRSGSIDVHVVSRNDQSVTPGSDLAADGTPDDRRHTSSQPAILTIPWTRRPSRMPRQILPAADADTHDDRRPIRAETRATLVQAIARGRRWLRDLIEGAVTSPQKIAVREGCSPRQVNMTISLAFLAPSLVQAAIDGTLPRGIGVASLRDMLAEWSKQHARLGLAD